MLRSQRQTVTQTLLGLDKVSLQILGVAEIAVEIGILRLGGHGLAMPRNGFVELAALSGQYAQSRTGVGSAWIEFHSFQIRRLSLIGSPAFLERPGRCDLDIGNLSRGELGRAFRGQDSGR